MTKVAAIDAERITTTDDVQIAIYTTSLWERCLSVCLSVFVCLSHDGTVSKLLNLWSNFCLLLNMIIILVLHVQKLGRVTPATVNRGR